jgi:hypothetical protein
MITGQRSVAVLTHDVDGTVSSGGDQGTVPGTMVLETVLMPSMMRVTTSNYSQ